MFEVGIAALQIFRSLAEGLGRRKSVAQLEFCDPVKQNLPKRVRKTEPSATACSLNVIRPNVSYAEHGHPVDSSHRCIPCCSNVKELQLRHRRHGTVAARREQLVGHHGPGPLNQDPHIRGPPNIGSRIQRPVGVRSHIVVVRRQPVRGLFAAWPLGSASYWCRIRGWLLGLPASQLSKHRPSKSWWPHLDTVLACFIVSEQMLHCATASTADIICWKTARSSSMNSCLPLGALHLRGVLMLPFLAACT